MVAAIAAVWTLYEAVKIRRGQSVQRHNVRWDEFNKLILSDTNLDCYNNFLYHGKPDRYRPEERVNWILSCWLNTLESILLDISMAQTSYSISFDILIDQMIILKIKQNYILDLMYDRGYSDRTIELFESYFKSDTDREFRDALRAYSLEARSKSLLDRLRSFCRTSID